MSEHSGFPSRDAQRRFEAARRDLMDLCAGRGWRTGLWTVKYDEAFGPREVERARWLVIALGVARGSSGGRAVAGHAHRGRAVLTASYAWPPRPRLARFDAIGLLPHLRVLPLRGSWAEMERAALALVSEEQPDVRYVSGHETLRTKAELAAAGHRFEP